METECNYVSLDNHLEKKWYLEPTFNQSPRWGVGIGGLAKTTYLFYSVPFYRLDEENNPGRVLGTVTAVIELSKLSYLLNKGSIGRLGSGLLINESGVLLAHPMKEYLDGSSTLSDVARQSKNSELEEIAQLMSTTKQGYQSTKASDSNSEQIVFFRQIESLQWSVAIAVYKDELYHYGISVKRLQIILVLLCLLFSGSILTLVFPVYHLESKNFSRLALGLTVGACVALIYIWSLFLNQSSNAIQEMIPQGKALSFSVDDQQHLLDFVDQQQAEIKDTDNDGLLIIPTGVFIQGVSIEGSNQVNLSGIIWQRYHLNDHKNLARGVLFPFVAPDPEALFLEKIQQIQQGEEETVVWEFRVILRLELNYSLFPFDSQQIGLRLQHPELNRKVMLIPDLDAYDLIHTSTRPGLDKELVLPAWTIMGTYFTFEKISRNTGFGLADNPRSESFPEYQFNILITREILTPFISHVFPILVVAALLYGTLINSSGNEKKNTVSGFSTFGVLETCGAFFFAIILVHIDLRAKLNTDVLTYLECLHLILYLMLLLVAIDVIVFTGSVSVPFLEYEENLFAKLLFWPLLLTMTLMITVYFFY